MSWQRRYVVGAITGSLFALISHPAIAQDGMTGGISLGLRSVDTSGAVNKYREDINLDDGVRVLDLSVNYRAPTSGGPVDQVSITADSLGGDPFESTHIDVRKFGAYRLKLNRYRSEYFYDDTILPAPVASIPASTGGDFHTFDFERIRESAALDITVSPQTQVSLGLDRQRRTGASTTTLDIQRDEFELDRPLDESLESITLGVTHAWQRVRLSFNEEIKDFDNASELFLPGASTGQNTTDPAELQFYMLDQSYDYKSRGHTLRVIVDPTDRLDISTLWRREDLDLDMLASESALGTDFNDLPFESDISGPADVRRDTETLGVDLGFTLGSRTRLIGGMRSSELDQSGMLSFGPDRGLSDWLLETDGYEVGAEYALRPNLILAGGWSSESRDAEYIQALNAAGLPAREETERDGYFLRVLFETAGDIEINAAIEDNSIDDPFTLASPTGSRRYKVSLRHRWDNGLGLNGSFKRTDVDNDRSGWAADTLQSDIRLSYRRQRLELSAGYSEIELDRQIEQLVTGGTVQALYSIDYQSDSNFADVSARWSLSARTTLGGSLRDYENKGSYPIKRDDWRAFVAHQIDDRYTVEASYRTVDYVEDTYDDYDADILELALRIGW